MSRTENIAVGMLHTAADLVGGNREQTHGTKLKNFQNIAAIWSAYLENAGGRAVTPTDVANMMELMKVARRQHGTHNPDDYIDGAGYAAVALEVHEAGIMEMQQQTQGIMSRAGVTRERIEAPSSGPARAAPRQDMEQDLTNALEDHMAETFGPLNTEKPTTDDGAAAMAQRLKPQSKG